MSHYAATPRHAGTTTLPGWDEMTDVDKGCALLHLHKREWEGASYAVREYPCEYLDDPRLTALTPKEACRHAVKVDPGEAFTTTDEYERLYNLALDEPDRRMLWGARVTDSRVITAATPTAARAMLASWAANETRNAEQDPPPAWGSPADQSVWAVMHRAEAGGQWHKVGDCTACCLPPVGV